MSRLSPTVEASDLKSDTGMSSNLIGGTSIDTESCPSKRTKTGRIYPCRCFPKCAICGYGPHMAIHGPLYGEAPGEGRPWGHEYQPIRMQS